MIRRLEELPVVPDDEPGEPIWYPIQHYFRLTAFGINAYVAREAGDSLLGEHDETGSDQEEVYVVTAGRARFAIDGEEHDVGAGSVVAVPDPATKRAARALEPGTTVIAIGGPRRERFESSWGAKHFEAVPHI